MCWGRGSSGSGLGRLMRPLWPAAAARVHVGTGRGSLASKHYLQLQHPQGPAPRAVFWPAGAQGRAKQVAWRAWSRVGTSVFTAKASTFRGGLRPVLQWVAPPALRCRPLVKGGCFRAAVARHSHDGTALCLCRMEITLLFNVIHERFKNKARKTHAFSHLYAPNFLCLKSERC